MARKMKKSDVIREFNEYILPEIRAQYEQDRRRDIPARCEAWNNFTDSLAKDGRITWNQCNNWVHPASCN
jgi:hypothetical protein